jgi:hypothetical protein
MARRLWLVSDARTSRLSCQMLSDEQALSMIERGAGLRPVGQSMAERVATIERDAAWACQDACLADAAEG